MTTASMFIIGEHHEAHATLNSAGGWEWALWSHADGALIGSHYSASDEAAPTPHVLRAWVRWADGWELSLIPNADNRRAVARVEMTAPNDPSTCVYRIDVTAGTSSQVLATQDTDPQYPPTVADLRAFTEEN